MPVLSGYDVNYSHRGSRKATRYYRGKQIDEVPVTWSNGWTKTPSEEPTLIVWFQNEQELKERLEANASFIVAVAKWVEGSASSQNLNGLFEVAPIGLTDNPKQLLCRVLRRCPPAGETSSN